MDELNICSLNCRGLGNYKKRRDVFHYLRSRPFHIYMLQDIHCSQGKENIFRNAWGTNILIAPYRNNARGVAILCKGVKVTVCETRIDEGGNYIIANVIINDTLKLVLANVYGPNDDRPKFYENIGKLCEEFEEENTPIVMGGDFNIALDNELDTSNYVRENNVHAREALRHLMNEKELTDIFRERNGKIKSFTWRNTGGQVIKQARLDYFIVSRSLIPKISETSIVPGYRTDHAIVTLKLNSEGQKRGKGFFKFNNSLLQNEEYSKKIRETIRSTLLTYTLPIYTEDFVCTNPAAAQLRISWITFWETLILNIRTETISFAIHKAKCKNIAEKGIMKEIQELEEVVQRAPCREAVCDLEAAREKLEQIRMHKIDGIITRSRVKWHEKGERSTSYFLSLEKNVFE